MSFFGKLSTLDRRWVFLAMALAVAVPLLYPLSLPMRVTKEVQSFYDHIENLPAGSRVLISADYDPTALPELYPMHIAILEHCFRKKLVPVMMALWPVGPSMHDKALEAYRKRSGESPVEGRDYVRLGYMAGQVVVIKNLGSGLEKTFAKDQLGTPLSEVPALQGVRKLEDFPLVVNISAGNPGLPEWVQNAADSFGRTVIGGCTAVSAPQLYPYFPKQLQGLLGGLKGAAEYEKLLDLKGLATAGMDAQSIAHLAIIFLVVLGNIAYFVERWLGNNQ